MTVMPRGCVLNQLSGPIADCPEHDAPGQQLSVSDFVELLWTELQQSLGVPTFEFGNKPMIEFKLRLWVFPGSWKVRHATTSKYGYPLCPRRKNLRDCFSQSGASFWAW